jgi:hypothetical protein
MSNLKTKAQLLSKLYYSFVRWKIWGRFMKNYRFLPLSVRKYSYIQLPDMRSMNLVLYSLGNKWANKKMSSSFQFFFM